MAACLLTFGGTSGTVRINYTLSGHINVLYSTFDDVVYIDDSATSITYETLTGDATVTSGCVTITPITKSYYLYLWDVPTPKLFEPVVTYFPNFTGVTFNGSNILTSASIFELQELIQSLNCGLNDYYLKIIRAGNILITGEYAEKYTKLGVVIQVINSEETPELKIESPFESISYIKGESIALIDVPEEFGIIDTCIGPEIYL